MKKIAALILTLICTYSCHRESLTTVHYYYLNNSGVDVKIVDLIRETEIVSIDNDMVYQIIDGDEGYIPYPFRGTGGIEVIFNGNRSIKYRRTQQASDLENDPLSIRSYRVVPIKEDKCSKTYIYEYHYTFTEKQYQDAEPYVPEK